MKILIVGGGSVGRFIAEQLASTGNDVTVLEADAGVVERHRPVLPGQVQWAVGDGCDIAVLARAGARDADVVTAVTGDDEDNLVASLLSKQEFAVPRVIARVNNPNNEWMFTGTWGVDVAVSTPHLITGLVQAAVTEGSFIRLLTFGGGKARLAEVTLAHDSPAVDKEIVDLRFPRDATVVAVLREQRVIVPRGDTILRARDEVLVLVAGESEAEVRAILVGTPEQHSSDVAADGATQSANSV